MNLPRTSGVQLHVTSLPDGRLGPSAYRWVDWLADAGQTWWQVLPLGPPDRHRSPYKAASAFTAWPGLLADPGAAVSGAQIDAFREREAFWIEGWERRAGRRAVADQVRFEREWSALRGYANQRGVRIVGDVPIYVAPASADHETWPELFQAGATAGVPPDAFTDKGQHWGNPLYDWPALRRRRYRWWTERLRRTFEFFDLVRIDHFRAFVAYWAVPAGAPDARSGTWKRGPGRAVFDAATAALGPLPVIAEDLGVITPPVTRLRRALGFPGMSVLQFREELTDDRVAYTSTHDTDTIRGWWESLSERDRAETGLDARAPHWSAIEQAWSSPCPIAMTTAQDVLGLGSEARMNFPGRAAGQWRWRLEPGALTARHARSLRTITADADRLAAS